MGIDHRNLLKKYIEHVGVEEGSTFLHVRESSLPECVEFTDEEWDELKKLEYEPLDISEVKSIDPEKK